MNLKQAVKLAMAVTSLSLAAAGSQAATYQLGTLLSGTGPQTPSLGTLTVTQSGADLNFTLSAEGLDLLGANAFLGAIAVDGVKQGSVTQALGGAPVSVANGGGPGGSFDFRFDLTGPKQARLTDNESVSWTWSGANQSLDSLHFAAHIQGVSATGASSSLWYSTAPVPEPESFALLAAGLGVIGLSLVKRR
ncbi:MAG: PEP-CTERM sorting domain-containing protein [Rubrivivax sp.]|nr:MAG: PEP-CTERM sorting domain-containing protein [Rubrivivax sp.]